MKVEKTIKKIRKAIDKTPDVARCLVEINSHSGRFKVGAKNKVAFRFFRDQLEGAAARSVNHYYGIGGSMEVTFDDHEVVFVLFNENGKKSMRVVLKDQSEDLPLPEAADDINYALPA